LHGQILGAVEQDNGQVLAGLKISWTAQRSAQRLNGFASKRMEESPRAESTAARSL